MVTSVCSFVRSSVACEVFKWQHLAWQHLAAWQHVAAPGGERGLFVSSPIHLVLLYHKLS